MKTIELNCAKCNKLYTRLLKSYKRRLKLNPNGKMFCSRKCQFKSQITRLTVVCLCCGKEFERQLSSIEKCSNGFCSQSCSGSYNGHKFPKRKLKHTCKICGTLVRSKEAYCKTCKLENERILNNQTLQDVIYTTCHKSSAFALVKSRARSVIPKCPCEECGFSHTEVCHIKPVSSFTLDTKVSVVNDPSNLKRLCPNCHWLFDHPKKLCMEGIEGIEPTFSAPVTDGNLEDYLGYTP
jgi:hypothetical protein